MDGNKWRHVLVLFLALIAIGYALPVYAETAEGTQPNINTESAVLIDARTGTVLYARNAEKEQFPASITKIVTGIVALETDSELSRLVTVSKEARNEDGTRIYLAEGEQQTMENLLYGMLMNSGNDAATAIAESIDGTKAKFAERMNAFVRDKVGVTHTHFVNPSGLPSPDQVTTALDMAQIAQYAMRNDTFRTIVGTKRKPWVGKEWTSTLINHNEMLGNYEGTTGIKNGYTGDAGFTLVTSAKRDGLELIGVLLKSPTKAVLYKDMTKLLDFGFQYFEMQPVMEANQSYPYENGSTAAFTSTEPLWAVVPKGETPVVTVSDNGEFHVQTSLGTELAGTLQPVMPSITALSKRYPEIHAEAMESVQPLARNGTSVPSKDKKLEIFFIWIGLLVYLSIIAYLRLKRQKLERGRSM
ncbi:D-alanyl-D-alanine carboxypeptidase family protein [Paenibacillus sp. R14(2021)]|uniref:D-alanyl-D-alanine carboxypeptidase family protein n=1 Tax=Paenibacillus sp. R14(2021) TaxID=2859228 RepID=UPI00215847F5|nr:D-alanyl-D-alanine carboxypeptidase family protein [Paenibacillus sp. R14(2021)]